MMPLSTSLRSTVKAPGRLRPGRLRPRLRRLARALSLLLVALAPALGTAACGGSPEASSDEAGPVARVEAVRARQDTLVKRITAYGTVRPAPGARQNVAVPYESRVQQVLVSPGQTVDAGTPLVRLAPSPAAQKQIEQARAALHAAQQQLEDVQQRFDLQLATRSALTQQQQAYQDARARYASVRKGAGTNRITASAPGLVRRVPVEEGALVAAGSPLVTLTVQDRYEVRLGVEPEEAALVQPGQRIYVEPVGGARPGAGGYVPAIVRSIGTQVDSQTRRVEVLAAPQRTGPGAFLLNEFVRGRIAVASAPGLVLPRAALLPEQDRYTLFTIRGGKAVRHTATLGLAADRLVQVVSAGVQAGDSVAVVGNYELENGMRVRTRPPEGGASGSGDRPAPFYPDTTSGR